MSPFVNASSVTWALLLVLFVTLVGSSNPVKQRSTSFPASPVVGILSQPHRAHNSSSQIENDNSSQYYIAASYVKWVEAGGARSIPIPYDATDDLLDDLFEQVHALLLPGGTSALPHAVTYLLNKAYESNQNGRYFPVWGTCLGFEFLIRHVAANGDDDDDGDDNNAMQSGFRGVENVSLPLHQVRPVGLYRDPTIFDTVTQENVTLNNHKLGIEPWRFVQNKHLASLWQITSVNRDASKRPFVSTIEPVDPINFPFYGVQYHPEKNAFEYATWPHTNIPYEDINHSPTAIAFSLSLARFFVDLCRRAASIGDHHAYTQPDRFPLITTYPQRAGIEYEQIYIVPPARHFSPNSPQQLPS